MNRFQEKVSAIFVAMSIGILTTLTGCASGLYGLRPDQVQVDLTGDPYKEYVKMRQFAVEMTGAYDSRSSFNRGAIYAGSTALLGLTAASSGLAAFGAEATGAGKSLPAVSTFLNGLFGVLDSPHLAQAYTTGANKLRRTISESDAAFVQEPTINGKMRKVTALQEKSLDIISEVEEARNSALPDPRKVAERAIKAKDEIEEALAIKPKVTAVIPQVVGLRGWKGVRILGSGFDSATTVELNGDRVKARFVSEGEIQFDVGQEKEQEYALVVRNRFSRETGSPVTFVQADLKVEGCEMAGRTKDPKEPVVLLIEGTGFQEDGSIGVEGKVDGEKLVVKRRIWRAHTQWEVQLENSKPETPIEVDKVFVTNKRDGEPRELAAEKLAGCRRIEAKK